MVKKIFWTSLTALLLAFNAFAQKDLLRKQIMQITATKKANVGVAICGLESGDTLSVNNKQLPMQSIFKFHIALYVLHQVDKGKMSLSQKIYVRKSDLLTNTWSPLQKKYPKGDVRIPLDTILSYTVSQSDNNGCDILLRLIGGTKVVNDYIHSLGIREVSIKVNEEDMHRDERAQFRNWTTPVAAIALLQSFYNGKILSNKSYDYLLKIMTETSTGTDRIKGGLPAGTIVAHKTGTSGTNKQGIFEATNDIGIVTLSNGHHFAISVFVAHSEESEATTAKIIADISRVAWDYFTTNQR